MEDFSGVADGGFAVVPDDVVSGAPFLCWIVGWAGFGGIARFSLGFGGVLDGRYSVGFCWR